MLTCTLKDNSGTHTSTAPSEDVASRIAMRWATLSGKPTLYFACRDITPYRWSLELACSKLGLPPATVEEMLQARGDARSAVMHALRPLRCTGSFGYIDLRGLREELDAYEEIFGCPPWGLVLDGFPADAETRQPTLDLLDSIAQAYMLIDD